MMEWIEKLYRTIGSVICHQIPERTLYMGGIPLPVCARDTGIYLGIFLTFVFIIFKGRLHADRPPSVKQAVAFIGMMLPMALDGLSSYAGLRETDNTLRLLTGMYFGLPIPFLLVPAARFKIQGNNARKVLGSWYELVGLIAAGTGLAFLVLEIGIRPWLLTATVVIFSIAFLLGRLAYTLVVRFGLKEPLKCAVSTTVITLSLAGVLYLFSNYVVRPVLVLAETLKIR